MAGQQIRRILDAHQALQLRFPQIARNRERNENGENQHAPQEVHVRKDKVRKDVDLIAEGVAQKEEDDDDHVSADRPFPGLLRRNRRRHVVLAPGAAAEISGNVGAPDNEKNGQHKHPVAHFKEPQERQISGGDKGVRFKRLYGSI